MKADTKQLWVEIGLLAVFALGSSWMASTLYRRWLVTAPPSAAASPAFPSRSSARGPVAPGPLIEAENLRLVGHSPGLRMNVQETREWAKPGTWSGDAHLFVESKQGDFVEMELPRLTGKHRLTFYFSRGNDYGTLRLSVNGKAVASEVDTGPTQPAPIIAVDAGVVKLAGEGDILRVEVTDRGARSKAPYYQFGFDGLTAKRE